jgi:endo-beta-N-acetylglucosaminidase D
MSETENNLRIKINFLKEELEKVKQEKQHENNVKRSEVALNQDLTKQIETQKIYIETLSKINDDFIKQITELRIRLKNIVLDMNYETTQDK